MTKGFTEKEAKAMIGKSFETHAHLTGVPLRARGQVVEALDSTDHWNVVIEWNMPGRPFKSWYNKADFQSALHPVKT